MQKDSFSPSDMSLEELSVFSDPMDDEYASSLGDYAYHGDTLYPVYSTQDQWDWGAGPYTPVPGFGYFPVRVKEELDHMTQVGILYIPYVCSEYT